MKPADHTEDPTLPVLVAAGAPATVAVTMDAVHQCPFRDETDVGTITVTWNAGADTVELHSLRAWLDTLDEWAVSHEAYTEHVRDTLATLGVHVVSVVSEWATAGAIVEVSV